MSLDKVVILIKNKKYTKARAMIITVAHNRSDEWENIFGDVCKKLDNIDIHEFFIATPDTGIMNKQEYAYLLVEYNMFGAMNLILENGFILDKSILDQIKTNMDISKTAYPEDDEYRKIIDEVKHEERLTKEWMQSRGLW